MNKAISVAVVDDHPLFREGVVRTLGEFDEFDVVAEGGSCEDAIRIASETRPDVLLLDLSMPGGGLNAIAPILTKCPEARIVALTVSEASDDLAAALNDGVKGYVLKGVGSRALAEVLRSVVAGETYVTPTLSARLLSRLSGAGSSPIPSNPVRLLSNREREVIELVAEGMSNKQIALRLNLHEKTVRSCREGGGNWKAA